MRGFVRRATVGAHGRGPRVADVRLTPLLNAEFRKVALLIPPRSGHVSDRNSATQLPTCATAALSEFHKKCDVVCCTLLWRAVAVTRPAWSRAGGCREPNAFHQSARPV